MKGCLYTPHSQREGFQLIKIYNNIRKCNYCGQQSYKGRIEPVTKIEREKGINQGFKCANCIIKS